MEVKNRDIVMAGIVIELSEDEAIKLRDQLRKADWKLEPTNKKNNELGKIYDRLVALTN